MKKVLLVFFICCLNISSAFSFVRELPKDPKTTHAAKPIKNKWSFEGSFGSFDRASAQRGFQVYKEVCSACHGLKRLAYRNLADIGFTEKEIKFLASEYLVVDGPDDEGEMFERTAKPFDRINGPYVNNNQARAANGGAFPPDLSLIVKARPDGANYIYSLLAGYQDAPEGFELTEGKNYNIYYEGRQIAMPSPISDDLQIEYGDGTFASKEQMIVDVVNFLQYAAEPEMEKRKKMGIRVLIFLGILFVITVIAKRMTWKDVK
jgi:ubiquinol-cytochrome c reductase cytochrome c1 subunit